MRIVYLIFGALAVLFGFAIAVWVGYNLLVQRQREFMPPANPVSYLFPLVMIIVGFLMLRKGIRGVPQHEPPDASEE